MADTKNLTASARLAEVERKLAEARAARDDLEAHLAEQATDRALTALEKAEAEVARLERLHAALQRAAAKEMNIGELRDRLDAARSAFDELRSHFAERREIRKRADELLAELREISDRDEQTTRSIWDAARRIAEAVGAKNLLCTIDVPLAGRASAWSLFYRFRDSRVARVLMPDSRVEIRDVAYLGGRETPLEEALDRDERTAGDRIVAAIDAFAERVARAEADEVESQEPEKPRSWYEELEAKRRQFHLAASGGLGAGGAAGAAYTPTAITSHPRTTRSRRAGRRSAVTTRCRRAGRRSLVTMRAASIRIAITPARTTRSRRAGRRSRATRRRRSRQNPCVHPTRSPRLAPRIRACTTRLALIAPSCRRAR